MTPLYEQDLRRPASSAAAVTPADGADLPTGPTRFLHIGTGGALKVDMADGSTVTFPGVPAGRMDIAVKRVYATGTTAANIVACY